MSKNYFDEYEELHKQMATLSERRQAIGYHDVTLEQVAEREALTTEIDRLRNVALDLIPYGATTPNKGWNGKRY